MGATFSRIKSWISETLSASDLNAEIDNILDNLTPSGVDDYSTNPSEMQTQTDPGTVGGESLATSLAGELARLRFALKRAFGTDYWYESPAATLAGLNTQVGASIPNTRIVSGEVTAASAQTYLLTPAGSGNGSGFTLNATATDLVYVVDNTEYTLAADVAQASTAGPPAGSGNANAEVQGLDDSQWTKFYGQFGGAIKLESIGAAVTGTDGTRRAYAMINGASREYFMATYDAATTSLINVQRGGFFDESGNEIPVLTIDDSVPDFVKLLQASWVFLDTAGALAITTNAPVYSSIEPTSPSNGDFWYDQSAKLWKKFDGASYVASNAVYVGVVITNESSDCVAARSADAYAAFDDLNSLQLSPAPDYGNAITLYEGGSVNVNGTNFNYPSGSIATQLTWDASVLDTGAMAADTLYFCYVTSDGAPKVSATAPMDMRATRKGLYHPTEMWRAVGQFWAHTTSEFAHIISYSDTTESAISAETVSSSNTLIYRYFANPLVKHNMVRSSVDDSLARDNVAHVPFQMSITVPNGATLDHADATNDNLVLHVCRTIDSRVVQLGISSHQWGQSGEMSSASTALTTSSDAQLLYTPLAGAEYALAVSWATSTQTTAGTWAANATIESTGFNLDVCRLKSQDLSFTHTTAGTIEDVANFTGHPFNRDCEIYLGPLPAGSNTDITFGKTSGSATGHTCYIYIQDTNAAGSPTVESAFEFGITAGRTAGNALLSTMSGSSVRYVAKRNKIADLPLFLVANTDLGTDLTIDVSYNIRELPYGSN